MRTAGQIPGGEASGRLNTIQNCDMVFKVSDGKIMQTAVDS